MIRAIAAVDDMGGLARRGEIPWQCPADREYFRRLTMGQTVLMGRKTWESIGHPLVERRNVVASHNQALHIAGCEVIADAEQFLNITEDVWIIGGAELFREFVGLADEIYLSHIAGNYECDQFFPASSSFKATAEVFHAYFSQVLA